MNQTETQRLAHAINELRPTWPISSLASFISRNLASRNYRDAAVALVFVALDADAAGNYVSQTPKRVLERGPWWKAAEVSGTAHLGIRKPPKRSEECETHPGQYADNCAPCQTDKLAYDADPKEKPVSNRPGDPTRGAALCRGALGGGL